MHGNGEESRKDPLHGGSLLLEGFEGLTSIVDMLADAGGQTEQDIASFLGDELGMSGWTEEMSLPFFTKVNWAAILEISDSFLFESHFSFAEHREISLAVNSIAFEGVRGCLIGSGIAGDDRLSGEIFDDKPQDIFCIIDGISTHGFDHHREIPPRFLEHGDNWVDFAYIGWMSDFPEGEFLFGIGHDMISVAPEVLDLFLERLSKMGQEAQSSIGVTFRSLGFIEAVAGKGGFEIVLSHLRRDGAGVYNEVFSRDDSFLQKSLYQLDTYVFQQGVRSLPEKLRKSFDRGRDFIEIESHRLTDRGIVLEFKG